MAQGRSIPQGWRGRRPEDKSFGGGVSAASHAVRWNRTGPWLWQGGAHFPHCKSHFSGGRVGGGDGT